MPTKPTSEDAALVRYDVSLADPRRLLPFQRGQPLSYLREDGGAPGRSRNGTQGAVFSVWAPNARQVVGHRQTSTAGIQTHISCSLAALRESGKASSPASRKGALYKFHIASTQLGLRVDTRRPGRHFRREAAAAPLPSSGTSTTSGMTPLFSRSAAPLIPSMLPFPSMRSTSARGCAFPKRTIVR